MRLYNINIIDTDEKILMLKQLDLKRQGEIRIVFGENINKVRIIESKEISEDDIYIAKNIIDQLCIKTCCKYQVKTEGDLLILGPVIGFLLGEQNYLYSNKHLKELSDSLKKYQDFGGLFIAFKVPNVDFTNNKVYGLYYNPEERHWHYGCLPLPQVIFRRTFSSNNDEILKLKNLGIKIFNSRKLDKWQTYLYLKKSKLIREFLPETERLTDMEKLLAFLDKHKKIVLKPANLSRGRGICFLEQKNEGYFLVEDYREKNNLAYQISNLQDFIEKGKFLKQEYILQKHIQLLNYEGSPFDVRVIVQKNKNSVWEVSGKECRLSVKNGLITNLARGGMVLPFEKVFERLSAGLIEKKVNDLSLQVAKFLDDLGENFGEIGLDIALDNNLKLWLIEVNFRPTYKGFKKIDFNLYEKINCKPVEYAVALCGFS